MTPTESSDSHWMHQALEMAAAARDAGEVPVGAVVVLDGRIVGRGFNRPIGLHDPSAHAEIQALRDASRTLSNYRLPGCDLYVTLEPCAMCAGAIQHARIRRLVYGAPDPKTGACGSVVNLFADRRLAPHTEVTGSVMAEPCSSMLRGFFVERRAQANRSATALAGPLPTGAALEPDSVTSNAPTKRV